MLLTAVQYAAKKGRTVLVVVQSVASRHRMHILKERLDDKLEYIFHDPAINRPSIYREVKKIRTVDKKSGGED